MICDIRVAYLERGCDVTNGGLWPDPQLAKSSRFQWNYTVFTSAKILAHLMCIQANGIKAEMVVTGISCLFCPALDARLGCMLIFASHIKQMHGQDRRKSGLDHISYCLPMISDLVSKGSKLFFTTFARLWPISL